MTIYSNSQEYEIIRKYIPDLQKKENLFTDYVIQGLERNRSYERKDLKDFLASIIDGRIYEQLKDLAKNSGEYEPFVVIEGFGFWDFVTKKYMRLVDYYAAHPDRELGAYTTESNFRAYGVGLIWTTDLKGTARYLIHENERLGVPKVKKDFPERGGMRKDATLEENRLYLLEAFGFETAKAFNDKYPSLTYFFSNWFKALDKEDEELFIKNLSDIRLDSGRRIGDVKANKIAEILGLLE
ncbi:MAG: hypothetical protein E6L02_07655 [Thaumarchaeota archaeon]|nr:MAG: hypothetical protein E6L02_07655 [Nitrososphaerota archaeon]